MAGKRLEELDVLRGLAALAVCGTHYTTMCQSVGLMDWTFHWGMYGPPFFFVISGFVILMTVRKRPQALDFLVARASRIYPAYWLAIPIAYVAFAYFPLPGDSVTLSQALINLTMLQTWLKVDDLDGVYWTLAVELKFYALAFAVILLRGVKRFELIAAAWLCVLALYWNLTLLGVDVPGIVRTPLNVDYGALFVGGVFFYLLKADGESLFRHFCIAASVCVQGFAQGLEAAAMACLFYAIFYLFLYGRLGFLAIRPLVWLGAVSYAFYLLQCPMGNIVMTLLRPVSDSPLLLSLASLAASLLAAWGATVLVEQPALHLVRRKYEAWKAKRESSAATVATA
jgi:peptidoglycan/LPS O-acetylase OafA/YrhL